MRVGSFIPLNYVSFARRSALVGFLFSVEARACKDLGAIKWMRRRCLCPLDSVPFDVSCSRNILHAYSRVPELKVRMHMKDVFYAFSPVKSRQVPFLGCKAYQTRFLKNIYSCLCKVP
jgi:hypothetical protein